MVEGNVQDILDNPDLVFVFGFTKNNKFYVHPVVVQGLVGAHGRTVVFSDQESASGSVSTLMDQILAPMYVWGEIDPRNKKFHYKAVRSKNGTSDKDSEWEQTEGAMTFEDIDKMFSGSEVHEDIIAMMEDKHPPEAIEDDVLEILISDSENGGDVESGNIFVSKSNKLVN